MFNAIIRVTSEKQGLLTISKGKSDGCFVWEYEEKTDHLRFSPRAVIVSGQRGDYVLAHTDHLWLATDVALWDEHVPSDASVYDFVAGQLCEAVSKITLELNPFAEWPDNRVPALVKLWDSMGLRSGEDSTLPGSKVELAEVGS
jgi:hypothetical protein